MLRSLGVLPLSFTYGADQAIAHSARQGAHALELRTKTSLARLWSAQAKDKQAHDLLSNAYSRFGEGFDTADLKQARAVLAGLDASRS